MPTSPSSNLQSSRGPRVVSSVEELREAIAQWRQRGQRLGLVPTMGALHDGHLSLVRASRAECDVTLVTIFVNPTQFGPNEDFAKYPRTLDTDLLALAREQTDLVFTPPQDQMFPESLSTYVEPPSVAAPFEGVCRPGHFRGVATVVLKLFHLIPADVAYFGQKDYQQCRVIERMVADLDLPIEVRRCPIVREQDGLAMSSRNRYLSPEERRQAVAISRCLQAGCKRIQEGARDANVIREAMRAVLASAGISRVDYLAIAHPDTLHELQVIDQPAVLLVAARVGSTRLIDNWLVPDPGSSS